MEYVIAILMFIAFVFVYYVIRRLPYWLLYTGVNKVQEKIRSSKSAKDGEGAQAPVVHALSDTYRPQAQTRDLPAPQATTAQTWTRPMAAQAATAQIGGRPMPTQAAVSQIKVFCPQCGVALRPTDRVCPSCGTALGDRLPANGR